MGEGRGAGKHGDEGKYQVRQICKAFWETTGETDRVFERGREDKIMTMS